MVIEPIVRRDTFLAVKKDGASVVSRTLVLQAKKNLTLSEDSIRVGITVTKQLGGAVVRNMIKRRLRSIVQEIMPDMAKSGYDYVIVGRKLAVSASFSDLKTDFSTLVKKIGTSV